MSSKKGLAISIGIFFLALVVRAIYLCESSSNPSFLTPIVDSATYDSIAGSLASGEGMSDKFFWQPFFYPFFLSIVYLVSGSSIICVKVLQIILGSVSCVLSYRLAKKLFGAGSGIVAGVMTAFYGPLIFFDGELLAATWACFWGIVLVTLLVSFGESKKRRFALLLGLCAGLSVITRPTFLPFLFISLVWMIVAARRGGDIKIVQRVVLIIAGFGIITASVAFQNYRVTGHFKLLPSSGGINFYIGNNPESSQTLTARPGWDWQKIDALPEEHGFGGDLYDQQRYFKKEVLSYISTRPLDFCKGLIRKTVQFVNSREIPRNVDIYTCTQWSHLLGLFAWKIGNFGFPFGLLLPLTVIGIITHYKKTPAPILWFLLLYPASIVLVFVSARYRVVVIPVMAALAAPGLLHLFKSVRERNLRPMLFGVTVIITSVLVSSLPGPFPEEKINFEAELYRNVGAIYDENSDIENALEYLNKALAIDERDASVHFAIAGLYAKTGETDKTIEHYQRSLELKPGQSQTHNNLGLALSKGGQLEEAIEHLKEAISLEPQNPKIRNNLAKVFKEQGEFEQAMALYAQSLEMESDEQTLNDIAVTAMVQGNYAGAIDYLQQALQLKPEYLEARNNLGVAYYKQGKLNQALEHFNKALKIDPGYSNVYYNIGLVLAGQNKHTDAIENFEKAIELKPDGHKAYNDLAMAYEKFGKNELAIENYMMSLKIDPDYVNANYNLGALYYRNGESELAVKYWIQTARLKRDFVEIYKNLAWILSTSNDEKVFDPENALKYAEHACELTDYRQGQVLDTLSVAYGALGQFDLGIETGQQALELASNSGNTALAESIEVHLGWYRNRIFPRQAIK